MCRHTSSSSSREGVIIDDTAPPREDAARKWNPAGLSTEAAVGKRQVFVLCADHFDAAAAAECVRTVPDSCAGGGAASVTTQKCDTHKCDARGCGRKGVTTPTKAVRALDHTPPADDTTRGTRGKRDTCTQATLQLAQATSLIHP